ncbi:MAG: insulinase family protein [Phycisphaerales bacterium]|nr:insulinase family protein [Phycisphaerales bacterium]
MAITFHDHVLPNGLRIAAEVDPDAHSAAVGFFVRTGARDESTEEMGVSHFLEHMMFKGSTQRTGEQVDRDLDDLGGRHNAYTSAETTAFHVHCLPESLPEASDILADILRPALRESDFDDEKKVILEEIAMYEDQPFWRLYERASEVYYGTHPLGHRVLGTSDSVSGLSCDRMRRYFEQRYSADNTVVAMAGALDFDAMVGRLESACGDWARTDTERMYQEMTHSETAFTEACDRINRDYMLMLAPAPAVQDNRRHAAALMAWILGSADGSRLYWSLIETGQAEAAQAQYEGRDRTGQFLIWCICDPETADEVETTIRQEIDNLVSSITEDDLERVRAKAATAITLHGELPAGRMQRLGRLLMTQDDWIPLEDELDRICRVTTQDIAEVADEYPMTPVVTGHLRGS